MPRILVLILLLPFGSAFAQPVRVGFKVGLRATPEYESVSSAESKRYSAGPSLEIGLPLGLGFEADALYSRLGYTKVAYYFGGSSVARSRTNSWEIPLLVKKTLPIPLIRSYAVGGYAPRLTRESNVFSGYNVNFPSGTTLSPYRIEGATESRWTHGLVAGGGVETFLGRIRLSPEVRYTRWNRAATDVVGSQGYYIRSEQNQVQILLGVSWKVR